MSMDSLDTLQFPLFHSRPFSNIQIAWQRGKHTNNSLGVFADNINGGKCTKLKRAPAETSQCQFVSIVIKHVSVDVFASVFFLPHSPSRSPLEFGVRNHFLPSLIVVLFTYFIYSCAPLCRQRLVTMVKMVPHSATVSISLRTLWLDSRYVGMAHTQ